MRTATAYNRAYLATCLRHSAQIFTTLGISDVFGPLFEMAKLDYEVIRR